MPIYENTELTPKEHLLLENERDENRLNREHAITIKRLDLEVEKLDVRLGSLLRLPALIIKLPLYVLLGVGFIVFAIRGTEPGESFWRYLS